MPVLTQAGLIFSSYLGLGRTGAIAACLFLDIGVGAALGIALLLDLMQIPVYGLLLETSARPAPATQKLSGWVRRHREKWENRLNGEGFWARVARFHPLAVVAISTLPIRGCGIISACVLTFMLGYDRLRGTLLIMTGSLIGALLSLAIIIEPVRFFHAP